MSTEIIPRVDETHVYKSEDGDIVIRQADQFGEYHHIFIPIVFAQKIADAILALCGE
jgi:hypothetical protein